MGSIGGAEILLLFLALVGLPVAVLAGFALVSRGRKSRASDTSPAVVSKSELQALITTSVSESLRPIQAALAEIDDRLSMLENARSHARRRIAEGEERLGDEASLGREGHEARLRAR